jgi:hypothetical protein
MKRELWLGVILLFGISTGWTMVAERAVAQGPAGAGASAVVEDSSHSLNPVKWVKKDSKDSTDGPERSEAEKKLTLSLQAQGVLAANVTATDACLPFTVLDGCLAVLHASHNLGLNFNCLRADVTGVHTSADVSGCKVPDEGKAQSLNNAIHQLNPEANAKQAAKDAEQQAKDDLKGIGG